MSFNEAVSAGMPHIAFAVTPPYIIIDVDNKADKPCPHDLLAFYKHCWNWGTYAEISKSGRGFHVVGKGKLDKPVKREHLEIYSENKFITFTGNAISIHKPADITEHIKKLLMGRRIYTDNELLSVACHAKNNDKFNSLFAGDTRSYNSASEADLALISILAYYSDKADQVRRCFLRSALGKREKAQRIDYFMRTYKRASGHSDTEPAETGTIRSKPLAEPPHERKLPILPKTDPPGLLADLMYAIAEYSIRPVKEISFVAALGFIAGIAGRQFNISNVGLNQYLVLVAPTGTGKEAMAKGINFIAGQIRPKCRFIDNYLGPAGFASGQGLIRALSTSACFTSVLAEFGILLNTLASKKANATNAMLKRVILDLYSKSGQHDVLRSNVYSDSAKNTSIIQSPALSLIGETTPGELYDGLDDRAINSGLLPRFSIIEVYDSRPEANKQQLTELSPFLLGQLIELTQVCTSMTADQQYTPLSIDNDAHALMDDFNDYCDGLIRQADNDVQKQLWNRAHLKALKVAGIIAIGQRKINVDKQAADWAIQFITQEINHFATKYECGHVGDTDASKMLYVLSICKYFINMPAKKKIKLGLPAEMAEQNFVPYSYIKKRTNNNAMFYDQFGRNNLRNVLSELEAAGNLEAIKHGQNRAGPKRLVYCVHKIEL